MTEFFHIMPKDGGHNDRQGPAGCVCEPELRRLRGVPNVRVVIHAGVKKVQMRAEFARLFEAFPDKDLI